MARSSGLFGRCYKIFNLFCSKPRIKINTTFIHFSIGYVESGFTNLDNLEKTVCIYSINVTIKDCYLNTITGCICNPSYRLYCILS